MPGKAAKVLFTEMQQKILQQFADSRGTSAGLAQRCQIVLQAFDGVNNEQIASNVHLGTTKLVCGEGGVPRSN